MIAYKIARLYIFADKEAAGWFKERGFSIKLTISSSDRNTCAAHGLAEPYGYVFFDRPSTRDKAFELFREKWGSGRDTCTGEAETEGEPTKSFLARLCEFFNLE